MGIFGIVKPILDTWTAWRWKKIYYIPSAITAKVDGAPRMHGRRATNPCLADARNYAFNRTLGVIAEALCIVVVVFVAYALYFAELAKHRYRQMATCSKCGTTFESHLGSGSIGDSYYCPACQYLMDFQA